MANIYDLIANPTQGKLGDIGQVYARTKLAAESGRREQESLDMERNMGQQKLDMEQQKLAIAKIIPAAQYAGSYTDAVISTYKGDPKDLDAWNAHKMKIYNQVPEELRGFLPDPTKDALDMGGFISVRDRAKKTLEWAGELKEDEEFGPFQEIPTQPDFVAQESKTTGELINVKRKEQAAMVQNVIGDKALPKVVETLARKIIQEDMPVAEGALQGISVTNELVELLDEGMFTGTASQFQAWMGGALQKAGFLQSDDRIENTQAYAAYAGKLVAQIIKEFGAGTGLSDADREYAEKIAGGKIALTEDALRKLHMLNVKYSRMGIEKYNRNVQRLPKEIRDEMDLSIEMPKPYSWETFEEATSQEYSDEDLKYTAEKYGITVEEVKERLRNAE